MLKLENISKYYYSSSSVTCALRKVNLEFKLGEFVAITGESGSGKTTLLNLISGLDSYEEGEMFVNGHQTSFFDESDWEKYRKEEIAFIFQNYNLIDSFTVLENVIVSYLIDGYSFSEAKEKAKEKIKLVGLEKDSSKKAAKLSGGQKQRLSIARALAKETNIIIADEPTGNLDAENGVAILSLLKELSKDKLVIVVTHNQGQIEPFVTRKIKLHDGEIVLDQIVEETKMFIPKKYEANISNKFGSVVNFSLLNVKSQPKKSILMFMLILLCVLTSFIFLGNFKMNLDENKTKTLETSLFLNLDDTRILVKKSDQSIITSNVLDEAKIKNVVSVEPYDYITDINYYLLGDYKYVYEGGFVDTPDKMDTNFVDMSSVAFVDNSHFMRSSVSLSSDMLKAGSLPENPFEMVLYSDDANILNTIQTVYFKNGRLWGVDTSYKYDVKVVGLLKERTEQVYFSEKLCQIMDLSRQQFSIDIVYKENYRTMTKTFRNVVIDPKITNPQGLSFDKEVLGTLTGERVELLKENNFVLHVDGERYKWAYYFDLSHANEVSSLPTLGVSIEIFDYIYNFFKEKEQFAIFIKDYAYTNEICSELKDNGFDTLSCFRASVTGYDNTKVINQYVNLVISVAAILFINFLIIILGNSLLKFKRNDYIIFKMIGMENSMCSKINYFEMLIYAILSNFLLVIIASIVKSSVYELLIVEMFKYVKFYDYLIVFLITLVSTIYLTYKFNKYIEKSTKITVMKEE